MLPAGPRRKSCVSCVTFAGHASRWRAALGARALDASRVSPCAHAAPAFPDPGARARPPEKQLFSTRIAPRSLRPAFSWVLRVPTTQGRQRRNTCAPEFSRPPLSHDSLRSNWPNQWTTRSSATARHWTVSGPRSRLPSHARRHATSPTRHLRDTCATPVRTSLASPPCRGRHPVHACLGHALCPRAAHGQPTCCRRRLPPQAPTPDASYWRPSYPPHPLSNATIPCKRLVRLRVRGAPTQTCLASS